MWGGKRPGAGRKPAPEKRKRCWCRLLPSEVAALERLHGSTHQGLRIAVERLLAEQTGEDKPEAVQVPQPKPRPVVKPQPAPAQPAPAQIPMPTKPKWCAKCGRGGEAARACKPCWTAYLKWQEACRVWKGGAS